MARRGSGSSRGSGRPLAPKVAPKGHVDADVSDDVIRRTGNSLVHLSATHARRVARTCDDLVACKESVTKDGDVELLRLVSGLEDQVRKLGENGDRLHAKIGDFMKSMGDVVGLRNRKGLLMDGGMRSRQARPRVDAVADGAVAAKRTRVAFAPSSDVALGALGATLDAGCRDT